MMSLETSGELGWLFDALSWALVRVDSRLRLRDFNQPARTLLNLPSRGWIGRSLEEVLDHDVSGPICQGIEELVSRRLPWIEMNVEAGEGRGWLNLFLIAEWNRGATRPGVLLLGRDVTRQARLDQARDERFRRLELIHRIAVRQRPENGIRPLLGRAVVEVGQVLQEPTVASCMILHEGKAVFLGCHPGRNGPDLSYLDLDFSGGRLVDILIRQRRRLLCTDVQCDGVLHPLAGLLQTHRIGSLLIEPVTDSHDAVYCLVLASTAPHTWSVHEVETLRDVREFLDVAVLQAKAWLRTEDESRNLALLASRDFLTGLPNRRMFIERLNEALIRARRNNAYFAVLIVDLDDFKTVNDRFGHQAGDAVLRKVSSKLRARIRAGDIVARIGGDEFAILADHISDPKDTATIAAKVVDGSTTEFEFDTGRISVSLSGGVAIYPGDGESSTLLLQNADYALYAAKRKGKGHFQHFSAALGAKADRRVQMKKELEHAIEAREFVLHYQPIYDLQTRRIAAVEALIRWQRPGKPLAYPKVFLPLVTELGLGGEVLNWVLHTACSAGRKWNEAALVPCRISVNVGDRQLASESVVSRTEQVLSEVQFNPSLLMIEATELSLMHVDAEELSSIRALNQIGVTLSVDDFGLGYSSLDQLARIPLFALKIGQDLMQRLPGDLQALRVMKAAVSIGRVLGVKVIAEGVETEDQFRLAADEGCDYCQGRLISTPLPGPDIPLFLHQYKRPL